MDITISPNPFREIITLDFVLNEPSDVRIMFMDNTGRVVMKMEEQVREPGRHERIISLAGLSSGTYHVQVVANKSIGHKVIIKN